MDLDELSPKKLHRDPDALAALAIGALFILNAHALSAYDAHEVLFNLLLGVVFGGRYGLRVGAVVAKGRALAAVAPEVAKQELVFPQLQAVTDGGLETNPPTGALVDEAEDR